MASYTIKVQDDLLSLADVRRKLEAFAELYGSSEIVIRGKCLQAERGQVFPFNGVAVAAIGRKYLHIIVDGESDRIAFDFNPDHGVEEITFISKEA
jgi:hypothetical protein